MFMCVTMIGHSQDENSKVLPLYIEASLGAGTSYDGVRPFDASVAVRYNPLSRLSIGVVWGRDFYSCKNMVSDVEKFNYKLGGSLGYVLFENVLSEFGTLELRANVLSSVGSSYFKNVAYTIGLHWYESSGRHKLSPLVGVGYCARDFSDKALGTHHGAYVSFGLRF